jgi:reductive dehalogenase
MIPRSEMKTKKEPYVVGQDYKRFPVTSQAFVTVSMKDTGKLGYMFWLDKMHRNMGRKMMEGTEGYLQEDNALEMGANAFNLLVGAYGFPNFQMLKWSTMVVPEVLSSHKVVKPSEELTNLVKRAAGIYGADLVGIAALDERWVYSKDMVKPFVITEDGIPEETEEEFRIPRSMDRAIVMAVAMDPKGIDTSPAIESSTATSIGYSRMGITAVSLAEYIRAMGYRAIPCMNDTAMSIPLAVDAGLGELGRLGILITPEFGPSVRLFKVLTDMPLVPDKPIDFGVEVFCKNCLLCAEHCPSDSISFGLPRETSSLETSNPGVRKWYINGEKCLRFWQENGGSCATCIAVCPFTWGFESIQCFECTKCETRRGCELQVNTHLRAKHGYLKIESYGERPVPLRPRREGL